MAVILQLSIKDDELKKIIEKYGDLENFKKEIKKQLLGGQ